MVRGFWVNRQNAATGAALAIGLGLRTVWYLSDPSLWHDELYVVYNLLHKSFGELLGPLTFQQAAPPLYLWLEKLVADALGDSTYALRLPAFAASCVALILFAQAAPLLVRRRAVPWAVLWLALSDALLAHSCEVKPYSFDVLAASALLWLYAQGRDRPVAGQLLWYAAVTPLLLALSYPTAFVFGGLLLALAPRAWAERRGARAAYAAAVLVVAVAAAALALGPVRAQRTDTLVSYWRELHHFPPWHRPWAVPFWAVVSSLEIGRYCFKPAGQFLVVLAVIGAVRRARRRPADAVALGMPLVLALGAGLAGVYPFGGSRLYVFAAPALAILAADAVPLVARRLRPVWKPAPAALAGLFLLPAVAPLWGILAGAPRTDSGAAAAYVAERLRPQDRVAGTNPESLYYFRRLGSRFTPVGEPYPVAQRSVPAPAVRGERLWLLVRGDRVGDRLRRGAAVLPAGWLAATRRDFRDLSVFLCTPSP